MFLLSGSGEDFCFIFLNFCSTHPTFDHMVNVKDQYQTAVEVLNSMLKTLVGNNKFQQEKVFEMTEYLDELNTFMHDVEHNVSQLIRH